MGVYLFTMMNWLSKVGFDLFPLSDSGNVISTFQEFMHFALTVVVVLLSVVSLSLIIFAGFKKTGIRSIAVWACVAFAMMFVGAIGQAAVPKEYFGIVERFSVLAAVGFHAVLGVYLMRGYQNNNAVESSRL